MCSPVGEGLLRAAVDGRCRGSGIHGGETVVERQGDYRIREPSRTPRRRWSVYSITTAHQQRLSILHMQNSDGWIGTLNRQILWESFCSLLVTGVAFCRLFFSRSCSGGESKSRTRGEFTGTYLAVAWLPFFAIIAPLLCHFCFACCCETKSCLAAAIDRTDECSQSRWNGRASMKMDTSVADGRF